MHSTSPTLWVVATPLGNLGDITERARKVLSSVDVILAEDTRRTGKLLQSLDIKGPGFISLHEHNEEKRIKKVLAHFDEGKNAALVSDAGTPLMSDPGYRLVRACREHGVRVVPVPGPCAPVTALSGCGLPPYPFSFLGFLPRKEGQMRRLFESFGQTGATMVFFERKSRLRETMQLAYESLGNREFAICRELTKDYEEFINGNLADWAEVSDELRGEITVVVGPPVLEGPASEEDIFRMIDAEIASGDKPKIIARRIAEKVEGWTAKAVYEKVTERKKGA
ncbi:16S rRNA (cytidine(1402)-2'-O)-methyltransferase [Maridesulfovibrio hydrothermalis]|uniref:Ribosomal RNA small subunit methyltransferase I n=1 Tax=Maridesulfovibrio hydrothermalis AM13 = DSM 14728 TaxID=1121451 RepID=L0RB23_9BACT|nr:16S rRNA (cytidine(1402)-2'-O)-methyltransferase [Maridesulfovibrio hydrothermalis]CCO22786.1 putative methyltransferase [Maridesulfovibrio hydrothermalis AM13 = DSM 14728]